VSADEAEVKREVVSMCRQIIALIDASKWGRVGPASFANPQDIHIIITDEQAPVGLVEQARSIGTRILQV
jgi:DeoR family transcriptional regulator of aga operon/DeoR family fructose operon transcriptional repressor